MSREVPSHPSVSIAIPALNEAAHIERVIREFLRTRYRNLIEVFVADGGSTDGTRSIVRELAKEDPRVQLVHNPQRYQSAGLNLILARASGDIFLRADAHSDYAEDYIERCVEILLETGSVNVGGAQRFVARTAFQAGVALASKSIIGHGRAKYRDPNYDGNVEAVYLGCFWRKALLEVSGYTPMRTCEDAELNLRLLDRFGSKPGEGIASGLYTSSRIKVWYYPRTSWWQLCKQYFNYGRGRCRTVMAHPRRTPLRGKLPFLFLSCVLLLSLADLAFFSGALHTRELVLAGLAVPFVEAFRVTLSRRRRFEVEQWRGAPADTPSVLTRALLCGLVLLSQPVAHFAGFGCELLRNGISRASE